MEEKIKDLEERVEFLENFIKAFYITNMGYVGDEQFIHRAFNDLIDLQSELDKKIKS